jgi:transcriptional regulator with XRE-family HTH domain
VGKAREYGAELKRLSSARLTRRSAGPSGPDSDGSDFFSDANFQAHFEDAEVRSCLLRGLIRARNSAGFKQSDVARRMETTQSAVSELESGGTDPRLSTLQRYARAVGAHVQVRLNLFSSIAQEPSNWPAVSPNDAKFQIVDFGPSGLQSGEYLVYIHSGVPLTEKRDIRAENRDIREPVAG